MPQSIYHTHHVIPGIQSYHCDSRASRSRDAWVCMSSIHLVVIRQSKQLSVAVFVFCMINRPWDQWVVHFAWCLVRWKICFCLELTIFCVVSNSPRGSSDVSGCLARNLDCPDHRRSWGTIYSLQRRRRREPDHLRGKPRSCLDRVCMYSLAFVDLTTKASSASRSA